MPEASSNISKELLEKPRILICDDEESISSYVQEYLSYEGMDSDFCGNGKEALELLKKKI